MLKNNLCDDNSAITHFYRFAAVLLSSYIAAVVMFYFFAGDQLLFRRSRGELSMPTANNGTIELTEGSAVEQVFSVTIQRLERIDVQWGTYYRSNAGTVQMELIDQRDGTVLLVQTFDAAGIAEGGLTSLVAETPLEGLYSVPLTLRLTADSLQGYAVSPFMNTQYHAVGGELLLNGVITPGMLCFAAYGTDYIWTGIHYWQFAAVGLVLLWILLMFVRFQICRGRQSHLLNAIIATQKYRFLIHQLVSRDFKTKYKRSALGIFWSFLNPLLTMLVQYLVFSTVFKNDISNYPAYLLIGIVSFSFFNEACTMALSSIIGNASLITKVYMPKYIYPLTRVISSVVNLVISFIPLLLVCVLTGVQFRKSAVLAFFFLVCLIVFSLGLGLILSSAMVFFRDIQFLWGVFSMIWMYATPIFYPESILPENFRPLLYINPLYHFLKNIRMCILDGISPEPIVYLHCFLIALVMMTVGTWIFYKSQNQFVLYL